MSKLAPLDDLLQQYYALQYHQNPALLKRLNDAQTWLKSRMQHTHQAHFDRRENRLMATYFLNRLYGGPDFDDLAVQIERLLRYAHKAEKLIPDQAIRTGTQSIKLAVIAMQLDEQIALQLLEDFPASQPISDEMMRVTLLKVQQEQQRLEQLQLLDDLGVALDKYMRSFMMYAAFKLCKGAAHKYRFDLMYEFIQEGFSAMKPLKSAAAFIHHFTFIERSIIEKVYAEHATPFA